MRSRLSILLALAAFAAACDVAAPLTDEVEADGTDDKADAAGELSVRVADTTLGVARGLRRDGDGVVLDGHTSRTLTGGNAFVFDDPYGAWVARGPKSFSVRWQDSELTSLITGVNQFVALTFAHSSGRPDALTARAVVRPRLGSISGSPDIYLTAELQPIVVGGRTVFRVNGHTTRTIEEFITVNAGGLALTDYRKVDDTHFTIDLLAEQVIALAGKSGAAGQLSLNIYVNGGGKTKTASLGLWLKKLGLTAGDAYAVWPAPTCTSATRTCLTSLPAGTADLSSCGEAIVVNACQGQVGAIVDDVAFQAALHAADARLADAAGFRKDAAGLVGVERADALQGGAHDLVEARLEPELGKWFADAAARDAALAADVDAAIDLAYARPLDLVPALPPLPNDATRARAVAADALLSYLAGADLTKTEWGRPLEALVHDYRAQHVESVRHLREAAVIALSDATTDIYQGDWLGALVEVTIERATGKVTNFLLEVD